MFEDKQLPGDSIGARDIPNEIMRVRPGVGCLTISNALQWRLQYTRAIDWAGREPGVYSLHTTRGF